MKCFLLGLLVVPVLLLPAAVQAAGTADEIHYTFTSPTSVTFDWRGTATDIRYGPTTAYGSTATSHAPTPLPYSSAGPYQEDALTGLSAGTTYHYSIGGAADHTFTTAPTGAFRFDVEADVGASLASSKVVTTQSQIAADSPSFVLLPGDLTYGNLDGQVAVDQHFNDVMTWSQAAAYMPAWGNHEWDTAADDLRNYKGRFKIPNSQTSADAPSLGCCGADWGWFDAGGVRFISYPEPYTSSTWSNWKAAADPILAAAQSDSSIRYIVTYGHRPAYSTGVHSGEPDLASALDAFGDRYPKYVLNLNGHSHDYERFQPIHGVTHITAGGGGYNLEPPWSGTDSRTAFRAMHEGHLRVDVSSSGMRVDAICGPSTSNDDMTCTQGSVMDSISFGTAPPPPPPTTTLYVDKGNASCSDTGPGTATQPFCTISAGATRVTPGQTVQVASGTYPERVVVSSSGSSTAPITFTSAPGATVTVTGQANGFYISNKSWITITGFTVTNTSDHGLYVSSGSSHITLSNNHVTTSGQPQSGKTKSGIYLSNVSDSVVRANTVDHNTSYGIYLTGSTRDAVEDNVSFSNAMVWQRAASGIRIYNAPGNTITSNVTHDNEDSGIEFDGSADGNLVANNASYNNGDHGIDVLKSTGLRIVANSVYKNVTAGINVEGNSTGATITNNIAVDNGIASPRTHSNIRIERGSTSGTTMDYDLVYLTTPDTLLIWDSQNYTSLAAFRSATGQEAHGIQASPRWTSPAAGDLHLTAGSPAIDSANSAASGQPSSDIEDNPRVDDASTPNTGVGPRAYDDRGAYEYAGGPALDHIVISPASATVAAGSSQTYTAQGFDASNNLIGDVTASTTFSIAPNGSCTANACTATAAGAHTVTGNDAGKTSTATLTVTAGPLDHLALSPATATIASGGSQAYTAEGRDQYDNPLGDVTSTTTFTIAPNGSCTGASCTASAAGAHTVTGTKSGKTGTASLQVNASVLDHIVVSPSSSTIAAGGSQSYSAQGFDASNNPIGDVTAFTTFTISPDGTCTGNVCTASVAGAHTVTGNDGGKTSTASLTVTAGALDHLVVSPASATIPAGGSQAYTAVGRDQYDNSLGDVTASTTFSIAPNGSCTGAVCTATASGSHTVTGNDAGKTGTAALSVTAGALDHLVLAPATATITAGGSRSYTAEGRDQYDNSLGDVTASTTFSIAPDGSCSAATCTASATGPHTVTGTKSGKTGTASLQVDPALIDHIVISPASASISAGGSQAYTAEGFDSSNNSVGDVTAFTTFTIAPNGSCLGSTCTATAAGAHTVTGNDSGKTDTASLTVTAGPLDHLVLAPASATISAGGSQAYTAAGRDQYGNDLGDVTSSTTFTIAPNGSCTGATCTASLAGTHTVTGTDAGKTGTASLDVTTGGVDHIVISPASASISAGGSQAYTAEGFDSANNSLGDVTESTTFSIGPDGSCTGATCTATTAGPHTVTGDDGGKTSTAALTVAAGPLHHLALSPASATIPSGGSQSYTADGRDQYDNSLGDVTSTTTFSISPNGSCTGASCGAVTAGAHTVTGTKSGKTGTASLQVTASGVLDHIVISPSSATIGAGGSRSYTAQGFDSSNNSLGDVTAGTTFSIAPDGSCSGNVCTATVAGSHTVTGNNAGKTSTASLTVNPGAIDHLSLSPGSATIPSGGSQAYTAQARDQYDNALGDVTAATTFSIAPNGSCSGATCTASLSGAHTVTGTSSGKTGTASLTVGAGALDHIVISPASATISAGGSQSYTAQGFDAANNSLGDVTAFTTFTIAPEGSCVGSVCSPNAGGPHTVTGNDSGKTATASLTVNFVRNAGFETDTSGWNTSGSGANITLTRVAGGHSGGSAAQLTNTGTTNSTYAVLQDSPNCVATTTAGTYTGILWVRANTAGGVFKLKFQEYSGSTLLGSAVTQVTLTTTWQQVTVTYTTKSPGSTLDFQAYLTNPAPGVAFYADDASIVIG